MLFQYQEAVARLESSFVEGGWVVSRRADGTPANTGDSLIWSGIALAALPCSNGTAIEDNLIATITRLGGAVQRYKGVEDASLDGALGLWFGLSRRLDCPGALAKWSDALRLHFDYVARGDLHPNAKALIPPGVDYVPRALAYRYGLGGKPDNRDLDLLELEMTVWAKVVADKKAAGYRIHLAYLALATVDHSDLGHTAFCAATTKAGMPLIDHFCGRDGLKQWISDFEFNTWEYALQRAAWETADGGSFTTPGLDLIIALKTVYKL